VRSFSRKLATHGRLLSGQHNASVTRPPPCLRLNRIGLRWPPRTSIVDTVVRDTSAALAVAM